MLTIRGTGLGLNNVDVEGVYIDTLVSPKNQYRSRLPQMLIGMLFCCLVCSPARP